MKKKREHLEGSTTKEEEPPDPESQCLTSTVSTTCPQIKESSHRKFFTGCPLCRKGVMLESGQRFCPYTLLYPELAFGFGFGTVTHIQHKRAFAYAPTHPPQQQQLWERCGCSHLHCNALICILICLIWITVVWKWTWKKNQQEVKGRFSGKVKCFSVPVGATSKGREWNNRVMERKKHEERKRLDIHSEQTEKNR